jgi:primosomal protein N' (replication factor Y)
MLRAEGRTLESALDFLGTAAGEFAALAGAERVTVYDAVPLTIVKVFNVHRAQLLLECASRAVLQSALRAWQPALRNLKVKGVIRWNVEVDPLDI